MLNERKKIYSYFLVVALVIASFVISIYFVFVYYIWNFNDYKNIKNVFIQPNTTYSLYKKIRNCNDGYCDIIAECKSKVKYEEGCPVNVVLMDNALITFELRTIYDIYAEGDNLVIVVPKGDFNDTRLTRNRKNAYRVIQKKDFIREFYKSFVDRGPFQGTYHWIIEYRLKGNK